MMGRCRSEAWVMVGRRSRVCDVSLIVFGIRLESRILALRKAVENPLDQNGGAGDEKGRRRR